MIQFTCFVWKGEKPPPIISTHKNNAEIVIVVYHSEIMAEKLINTQQHKTNVPLASAGGHLTLHGNVVVIFRDSTYENISNTDKIKQARGLSH